MFPLKHRELIFGAGCAGHMNRRKPLGCAADYVARYVTLYAPFDGEIVTYSGRQGGNWLRLVRANGDWIESAHLSKYLIYKGTVREGQRIAITGNTGQITTGPHLHIQIKNKAGERVDPEKYLWDTKKVDYEAKYKETLELLEQERSDHAESIREKILNEEKWQDEIEGRHKAEEELENCQDLLDSIRDLLK